jgi:hypothetical protein
MDLALLAGVCVLHRGQSVAEWTPPSATDRNVERFPFNGLSGFFLVFFFLLCINGKIWSMFNLYVLKYLARTDLILIFVLIFWADKSEAQTYCVSFNDLTF